MGRKRKGLSKRARFEVFKRDLFTCQYCGRRPPDVILEADHMVPVADGGEDHESNMVTACKDCNAGKSSISLEVTPTSLASQIAERQDRSEQTKQFNKFLLKLREDELSAIRRLAVYWVELLDCGANLSWIDRERENSFKTFLKRLPETEILDSIDIAFAKRSPSGQYDKNTWKYFCGVCWKKIKG